MVHHLLGDGCLFFSGGVSKGDGNGFDDISLPSNDRGGFFGKFCEAMTSSCDTPTGLKATRITATSAGFSWKTVDGATGDTVPYRKAGTTRWK
ncbi:MAG: hypothetical protein H0X40_06815 [Chthoniobacterales bacterium]|nr:hypothetical protein [Chthoniobacterales bacterium]